MGKSKDDSKRKRSAPSSSGDETRSKRHKSKEDDRKHKSRKKHKSYKSSKRHSDKDKKSSGKHKDKGRKHENENLSKLNLQLLSKDDYFSRNNEFALWLKEERNIFFSDLSSDSARSLFSEFVAEWNDKRLDIKYYEGISSGPRTAHQWNIKK